MKIIRGSGGIEWRGNYFPSDVSVVTEAVTTQIETIATLRTSFPNFQRFTPLARAVGGERGDKSSLYRGLLVYPVGQNDGQSLDVDVGLITEIRGLHGDEDPLYEVNLFSTTTCIVDDEAGVSNGRAGAIVPATMNFCDASTGWVANKTQFATHVETVTSLPSDGMEVAAGGANIIRIAIPDCNNAWGYALGISAVGTGTYNLLHAVYT